MSAPVFTLLSDRATGLYGVRVERSQPGLGLVGRGGTLAAHDGDATRWYAYRWHDDEGSTVDGSYASRAAAARALVAASTA